MTVVSCQLSELEVILKFRPQYFDRINRINGIREKTITN